MNENFSIAGKAAVITGGSGVLGSNIAEGFLRAGAKVIIIGAHQDRVDAAVERLKAAGSEVKGVVCNVLSIESLEAVKDEVLAQWGRIDILVNAAGGNIPGGTLTADQNIFDMKVEDLDKVVDLNLNGTVYPCLVRKRFFHGCLRIIDPRAWLFDGKERSREFHPLAGSGNGYSV